ncbi:MAG: isoprenylcysteine carboxylmethyltransferase family protein [Anaerolineales bacterium]|nr:MAG: isoprenylcysteine carboxylmethyltransferase family protein [Anaerolineales bacterium]
MSDLFEWAFLIGLIALEVIRFPHRRRNRLAVRQKRIQSWHISWWDVLLDMLAFAGTEVIPLVYIVYPWFNFANYALPIWAGWIGTLIMGAAVALLWKSHTDLGLNWTPTLQILPEHTLVTKGMYAYIRHPIYAATWLAALAQALLLANWFAGLAGLVLFSLVYLVRVPKEERMMLEQFGTAYQEYLERTGRLIPRLTPKDK